MGAAAVTSVHRRFFSQQRSASVRRDSSPVNLVAWGVRSRPMSLPQLQELLSRVLTDEEFRNLFVADPDRAVLGYKLTEQERASLDGIDLGRLRAHSTLLQHGRVQLALKAFPLSSR